MDFREVLNNFLIKLRIDDIFCEEDYKKIKSFLFDRVREWKLKGSVPVEYVVDIVFLIDQLASRSRFFDEETAIKVEDACIEIEEIIAGLE